MVYIPNTLDDRQRMLHALGIDDISELFEQIPDHIRVKGLLDIPGSASEIELRTIARNLSTKNCNLDEYTCFLGAGLYDSYIPSTVPAIISRSEFYTSYTPYQPEISQGNLQSIFEFQSLICQLTGMDVSNASMYDGATALTEAALMASSITGRTQWLVSDCVNPAYREVMKTYAKSSGYEIAISKRTGIMTDMESLQGQVTDNTACVIIQNPNFFGALEDLTAAEKYIHEKKALFIICYDPISLGLLNPPAHYNADICTAEGQPLGIPMNFGGPLLGLFSCKNEYIRQMPGRIVGAATDSAGHKGYTLTLQAREQHIRREKATSNICTNEALYALAATVYLSTVGPHGLSQIANLSLQKAHYAAESISEIDQFYLPCESLFFREFVIKTPISVKEINNRLMERKIIGGLDLERYYPDMKDQMLLCVTENRSRDEIDNLINGLKSCV
ncbi:MAG: aminomethyl-transferring glycine dehydrogenase subunit GcvPA [Armatimonadota bacterium]